MISVSKNKCVGCGLCILKCSYDAILINKNGVAEISHDNCNECEACIPICPQDAIRPINQTLVIALGTDDGKTIKSDDHVGMSKYYLIYDCKNGKCVFREKRTNTKYQEDETRTHGDPKKAKKVSAVLDGVDVVVGKIFGPNIIKLQKIFVAVVVREPTIDKILIIITEGINEIIEEKDKTDRKCIVLY